MRISILTSSISRNAGGLKGAINGLYKKYKELFSDNELIIFSYEDQFIINELNDWEDLELKLFKKTNFFKYSLKLRRAVLVSDTDLLHIHGLWMYPHYMSHVWKTLMKKPVLISPHGMLDPYIIENQNILKRNIANLLFANKAFRSADCFHALCKAEMEAMRCYGINKPIAVIPNGVNMPAPNKNFIVNDGKKHLLFLGRLHPKKGVDMLLEAIGQINIETPELLRGWIIDIVGWSQDNFDVKLQSIVKKFLLEEKVIFHGGMFGDDKDRMYAQADAYILPSHGEGLPLTILEAWSWETPVLMTPLCNIPEGFEAGAAIKIENNIKSIKKGLEYLFQADQSELKMMAEKGKNLVLTEFTWEVSAKKMCQLYMWLLNNSDKPDFVYLTQ